MGKVGVKFILGKASADHQQALISQLAQKRQYQPTDKFFYLVPNHIKFAAEVKVLRGLRSFEKISGLFAEQTVQVFSFTRLAWYFLKDTPVYQIPRLSSAGINMLVATILQDHQADLTIFRGEHAQIGFITQLSQQLTELQQNGLSAADLTELAQNVNFSASLQAKMHDLAVIYQYFIQQTQQQFLGSEGLLPILQEQLAKEDLTHSHFYITGFSQFNQQELALVKALCSQAAEVVISLVTDVAGIAGRSLPAKQLAALPLDFPSPNDLFYRSERLYFHLANYLHSKHIKFEVEDLTQTTWQRVTDPLLCQLETAWIRQSRLEPVKPATAPTSDHLQLVAATDRQAEIREVAGQIKHYVQQENLHYRDFVVMTRHLDLYRNIIEPIFRQYQIPCFVDLQHEMSSHPLVELLSALFDVHDNFYRYDDLMRLLKTELLLPQTSTGQAMDLSEFRQCLDLTENLLLQTGMTGKNWLQQKDWTFYRFDANDQQRVITTREEKQTQQVNLIRHFIKETLPPFFKKFEQAKTGKAAAQLLCQFLLNNGVGRQLLVWRDQALAAGDLTAASRPEETWNTFVHLLDEYVLVLGERPFDPASFKELLLSGFAGAQYSQVPSTLDQVTITETGMAQLNQSQTVFVIGATSAVMPDHVVRPNLLSDSDRLQLGDSLPEDQLDLAETSDVQLAGENYLAYLAFLAPSTRLVLSFPEQGTDGEELAISPYVKQIKQLFSLKAQHVGQEPEADITLTEFQRHFSGAKRPVVTQLLNLARKNGRQLPAAFVSLAAWLKRDVQVGDLANRVFASLNYRNQPEKLQPDLVEKLYGKTINTSISKLEEFYANQYAYFLKYGLKLKERDVFALSPANTGEFFHAVLDQLHRRLMAEQRDLTQISATELTAYLNEIIPQQLARPQFQILHSSARMDYLSRQLAATIQQVSWTIHQQLQHSQARPYKTEVLFGQVGSREGLRPLEFVLPQNHQVKVRGKIDRIDLLENSDQTYLGIVDYKSSLHKFNYRDAYYGMSLQMLTYLSALIKNFDLLVPGRQAKPAGAVYLHLQNPKLELKVVNQNSFEKAWLQKNKYDGLLLADPQLLELLDGDLTADQSGVSLVYPFRRKKAGDYSSTGRTDPQLITPEQLDLLLWQNEQLIKKAAATIFAGDLAIDPALWPDQRSALQYSPFKAIMQFDAMLPENNYHRLPLMSAKEVLAAIQIERSQSNGTKA